MLKRPTFRSQRLHVVAQPTPPQVLAEVFDDLERAECEVRRIREVLNRERQDFMARERLWGIDLTAFCSEIMRRAGR